MCDFLFWPNVCHNSSFFIFSKKERKQNNVPLCEKLYLTCSCISCSIFPSLCYAASYVLCFLFVLKSDCVLFNLFSGSRANCFIVLTDRDVHSWILLADITFKHYILENSSVPWKFYQPKLIIFCHCCQYFIFLSVCDVNV